MTDGLRPDSENIQLVCGQPDDSVCDSSESAHSNEELAGTEHPAGSPGLPLRKLPAADSGRQSDSDSQIAVEPGSSMDPVLEQESDQSNRSDCESEPDGPNTFNGASGFFSVRGFLAGTALFLLTLCVCTLAMEFVWSLAVSLLFTVAISTGHLVFYTRDRHVRERVYFSIVALGTFLGGALIVDLQLTHPYFIDHRTLNVLTSDLVSVLESDSRFINIEVSTELVKGPVAGLTGTVSKLEDRTALRILVEESGFGVGTFDVQVSDRSAGLTSDLKSR